MIITKEHFKTILAKKILLNLLVIVFTVLFLFGCNNTDRLLNNNSYFLIANGEGLTEDVARANALKSLSQNIVVSVENTFISNEELKNNSFNQNIVNNINLKSNITFVGVETVGVSYNNKLHKITLGLSTQAYLNTINYFFNQLNYQKIDSLSKDLIKKELENATILYSLILYGQSQNLPIEPIYLNDQSLSEYIEILKQKNNAQAIIKFDVYPNNATITINNKKYNPFTEIYLKAGNYSYSAMLDGYISIFDNLSLSNLDNLNIVLYLQKKLDKPVLIKQSIENNSQISINLLDDFAKKIINTNQMILSNNTNNTLRIFLDKEQFAILQNGYKSITIPFSITIKINDVVKTYNQNITYIFNSNVVNLSTIPSDFLFNNINKNLNKFLSSIY